MTEKKTVSVLLDPETLDEIRELQKKTDTFSRSEFLRDVIERGLKSKRKAVK